MDPHDYNVNNLKEFEYNEFEILSDDNAPKMDLNNSISPSTCMLDAPTSISNSMAPRKLRSYENNPPGKVRIQDFHVEGTTPLEGVLLETRRPQAEMVRETPPPPPRSIGNVFQLSELFVAQFVINTKVLKGVNSLLILQNGKNETLRNYNKTYLEIYNEIKGCTEELAVVNYNLRLTLGNKLLDSSCP
ncbi:hypothetical protein Acr_01g0005540 [Actinidia rufa]|uniref:Uncharacterized protein n=1 Tax=Actinidia rufa TaxID=165716 RepID=A0A7J0E2L1_9ERIC|nr:hypothetical protein Acr_01g0005540 [Actinidia rufa]